MACQFKMSAGFSTYLLGPIHQSCPLGGQFCLRHHTLDTHETAGPRLGSWMEVPPPQSTDQDWGERGVGGLRGELVALI